MDPQGNAPLSWWRHFVVAISLVSCAVAIATAANSISLFLATPTTITKETTVVLPAEEDDGVVTRFAEVTHMRVVDANTFSGLLRTEEDQCALRHKLITREYTVSSVFEPADVAYQIRSHLRARKLFMRYQSPKGRVAPDDPVTGEFYFLDDFGHFTSLAEWLMQQDLVVLRKQDEPGPL